MKRKDTRRNHRTIKTHLERLWSGNGTADLNQTWCRRPLYTCRNTVHVAVFMEEPCLNCMDAAMAAGIDLHADRGRRFCKTPCHSLPFAPLCLLCEFERIGRKHIKNGTLADAITDAASAMRGAWDALDDLSKPLQPAPAEPAPRHLRLVTSSR